MKAEFDQWFSRVNFEGLGRDFESWEWGAIRRLAEKAFRAGWKKGKESANVH